MRIKNIDDVNSFLKAVDLCKGPVCLKSVYGDSYNLKSELSKYLAIAALLGERGRELELFCSDKNDEGIMLKFMIENPKMR